MNHIKVIIISPEGNYHTDFKRKGLNFKVDFNGLTYYVRREGLYKFTPGLKQRVRDYFFRDSRYLIVFGHGHGAHLERQAFPVTPGTVHKIRKSRVLKKALGELFKTDLLGGRGMIFLIIAFIGIAVYLLKIQGVI